ncbi:membrane protein [Candidatus Magnetobacterium bavaricum]|uniref:Membrane protein n=1 Tax=Candidatus Magnetobacterium bavaricum TaxID=29290 RepID=A0A0F3GL52_9BACT|nr:membrane protein [Candidatus Magnetobacterium bavaricum]
MIRKIYSYCCHYPPLFHLCFIHISPYFISFSVVIDTYALLLIINSSTNVNPLSLSLYVTFFIFFSPYVCLFFILTTNSPHLYISVIKMGCEKK